jgi:hypothetical protein
MDYETCFILLLKIYSGNRKRHAINVAFAAFQIKLKIIHPTPVYP